MYWPIGPAKALDQQLPTHSSLQSYDEPGSPKDARHVPRQNGQDHEHTQAQGVSTPDETTSSPRVNRSATVNGHSRSQAYSDGPDHDDGQILGLEGTRGGHIFATITRTTLNVWQTKPAVILASLVRAAKSLKNYGPNVGLLIRPDAEVLVVQTAHGHLITYSLIYEPDPRVYQNVLADNAKHRRRSSISGPGRYSLKARGSVIEGGGEVHAARLQFRMVIRLDAGISKALGLENELIVITKEPAAIQCIRWSPDRSGAQFSTQLLANMTWLEGNKTLSDVVFDRPMNLFAFVSDGGRAYAVQRAANGGSGGNPSGALFDGHIFHVPQTHGDIAMKAAVNSRFSLIALGCYDGSISLYSVQNYAGGIRFMSRMPLPTSAHAAGKLTTLTYSPDGYCLFVGYEHGWTTWSVYGQPGGSSFGSDLDRSGQYGDEWLRSVSAAQWVGGGTELVMTTKHSNLLWTLEFARFAVTGCFNPANASRGLLQTSSGLIVYQGDRMTDLAIITADASVWQHVQVPAHYLVDQWPLKIAVISSDRRYIAIAGQRGLAHYSMASGRWRTFQELDDQNEFAVRGGMCWRHHVLVAAVETSYGTHELRLYSRELPLENRKMLHNTVLPAPVVNLSTSGDDGVLVYSYDNTLDHYIVDTKQPAPQLLKVGQITLSGLIRSPPRVRAVSWIVPDQQLQQGEASQDVTSAAVLFLIDGKLVLLQPSQNDEGELKYEMRVIASHVEYFILARDDPTVYAAIAAGDLNFSEQMAENVLKDSLWAFDGHDVKVWPNVQDLLSPEIPELDTKIIIPVDFYPFSVPLQKGLLSGAEAELTQRRDLQFSYFRTTARSTLFLPAILRYYLTHYDISSALRCSTPFQSLPYFSHALEILLHTVLDEEVENPSTAPSTPATTQRGEITITDCLSHSPSAPDSFLPTVLTFLSNFPDNLDIILQCTRKTELRSWRTLFKHLPPPAELFDQALQAGDLKTAGGYLLVLQQHQTSHPSSTEEPSTPDHLGRADSSRMSSGDDSVLPRGAQVVPQAVRLLRRARESGDWDLCKELARFLMALDDSGVTLRGALEAVERSDIGSPNDIEGSSNGLGMMGFSRA